MIARLKEMQKKWKAEGKPVLDIGVGLTTGVASVGNMGSALRYGYTALGDTVNLSSRLEGLNKEYGTHILLSETTYTAVEDPLLVFRELDLIRVKGKSAAGHALRIDRRARHSRRRRAGPGRTPGTFCAWAAPATASAAGRTRRLFSRKCCERWPEDGPARMYLNRCKEYQVAGPDADWDGVYVMTHK